MLFTALILVPGLFILTRKPWRTGMPLAFICLVYGPIRFFADFLRIDDVRYFSLTPAQYMVIAMTAFGVWVLLNSKRYSLPTQPPITLRRFF